MDRRKRELLKLAEGEGMKAISIATTGSCHYQVSGTVDGKTIVLLAPASSSDHRNLMNLRGNLRRMIRASQAQTA